jgi:hypothetical protein
MSEAKPARDPCTGVPYVCRTGSSHFCCRCTYDAPQVTLDYDMAAPLAGPRWQVRPAACATF